jgi:hypothetical protein
MTLFTTYLMKCNAPRCRSEICAQRPQATAAGWTCDSPRGLDFCPTHKSVAPRSKPRGLCVFCGDRFSLRKNGQPTQHTVKGMSTKVRCPGSYSAARRG